MAEEINYDNTGQVIDPENESETPKFHEQSESEKELTAFVIDHCERWEEYRDQNFLDDWGKDERISRGKWESEVTNKGNPSVPG